MEEREKVSIHQILWYFIIFSVIGLFIETIYCYITTGVLESRKGLIWGPFCPVYGVGASLLILLLNRFKDSKIKLLIYGGIMGDVIEYLMSYGLEAIYSTRFIYKLSFKRKNMSYIHVILGCSISSINIICKTFNR